MASDGHRELRLLVQSLQALALSFDRQMSLFPAFVHVPDELALLFDDCMRLAESTPGYADLTELQREMLIALDRRLEELSGPDNARFWTTEALANNTVWQEIRARAAQLLSLLGQEILEPRLEWMCFVETLPPEQTEPDPAVDSESEQS